MRLGRLLGNPIADGAAEGEVLRAARVASARRCPAWQELDGPLVYRPPYWIHEPTDLVLTPARGMVFEGGSVLANQSPLYFTVDTTDQIYVYERLPGTWSQLVARKARTAR